MIDSTKRLDSYAEGSFVTLQESLTPLAARQLLGPFRYGVVVRPDGQPTALCTAPDLERAALADTATIAQTADWALPALIGIPGKWTLPELIAAGLTELFPHLPHGAVLIDDGVVVGVLETELILESTAPVSTDSGQRSSIDAAPENAILPGTPVMPPVQVSCAECGQRVVIAVSFDRERPQQCGDPNKPHALVLTRVGP